MALNGHTVKISGKDLARIKEQYTPVREEPVREYVRKPTGETAATRYPQNNRRPAKEPDRRQVRELPGETNSHID